MQVEIGSGESIVAGVSRGLALVSAQPFSFWGDLDPATGKIIDPRNEFFGKSIKDRVFVYPRGRGSSTTSAILLEAVRCDTAPCAIINVEVEPILALGAIVAQEVYGKTVPMLAVSEDVFRLIHNGDYLLVDATAGKLHRKEQ